MPTYPSSPHHAPQGRSPSGTPSGTSAGLPRERPLAERRGSAGSDLGGAGSAERERVREASPVEAIIAEYGVPLRQDGRNFKALCPFHREKTPSFKVDPVRGTYRCFGCGEQGDVFSFVEKMDSLDFKGALRALAERAGIPLSGGRAAASARPGEKDQDLQLLQWAARWYETERRGSAGAPVREYLARRGFREATIDAFGLGWAPPGWSRLADAMREKTQDLDRGVRLGLLKRSAEGRVYDAFRQRVVFPIRDPRGRVIGFGGRHLDGEGLPTPGTGGESGGERRGDPPPKYINSPESELFRKGDVLYGQYEGRDSIRAGRHLLLMEGYTDVMMAHQAGFDSAVATLGTALTEANVERITRFADRVTLVFDGDRAGMEAARKASLLLAPRPVEARVVLIEGGEDPCDLLARPEGADRFRERAARAIEAADYFLERCLVGEDAGSAAGRDRVARAFLDYVERLPSEILRGTALERLAGRLGVSLARVERDFRAARKPPPRAAAPAEPVAVEVLPHEEEGILLAALAGSAESAVVFRLQPPERFRDPLLGRIAARIAAHGSELDPRAIESQEERAKALELLERRDELGFDADRAMRLLVELVRRHLRALAREGREGLAGETEPGWIRRVLEIRRVGAELAARPPHEPQALVEVLDRFDAAGASPVEVDPAQ